MSSSDDEKATNTDSTAEVSKKAEPITLDNLLKQVGVSQGERSIIKKDPSLWWPRDLQHLSPANIITEPQYCSWTARQDLYTIASQLSDHGDDSGDWDPSWDPRALMKTSIYHNNFNTYWQIRAKTKDSLKTGPQDEYSIPKKKITLQVVPVRPDEDWVTGRDDILAEFAWGSRFLQMSTALSTYNYEQARETEGTDPMNCHTTNLQVWIMKCIALDVTVILTKKKVL